MEGISKQRRKFISPSFLFALSRSRLKERKFPFQRPSRCRQVVAPLNPYFFRAACVNGWIGCVVSWQLKTLRPSASNCYLHKIQLDWNLWVGTNGTWKQPWPLYGDRKNLWAFHLTVEHILSVYTGTLYHEMWWRWSQTRTQYHNMSHLRWKRLS